MKQSITFFLVTAAIAAAQPSSAGTPHDPYIYWLPSGRTQAAASFTVKLRQTRMGIPDADLVLVRDVAKGAKPSALEVAVADKPMPELWRSPYYVIPASEFAGKQEIPITLSAPTACRCYLTRDFRDVSATEPEGYDQILRAEFARDWGRMLQCAEEIAGHLPEGPLGCLARMKARYARYQIRSAEKSLSARSRYLLGMYCMENGFWEGAAHEFELATKLDPENAEAWYMLADARAYRDGDNGEQLEALVPLYRKSAELRKRQPNPWNIYVGIFRKMRMEVDDGKGGRTKKLFEMSQANVDRIKKEWGWTSDILWAASRGGMKFANTFAVHDDEFDNTDPHAFDKLWKPGEQDVFMKFYENGPAGALGHDCGPNRTAMVDIGTWCGWEVYLHEWNHTLDWSMITSENGRGVPVTHSSDWCGFQPIPSMGRGHASCNHYYMTPGMLAAVKGAEVARTGYNDDWLIQGPFVCEPNKGLETAFAPETGAAAASPIRATSDGSPWFDLKNVLKPTSESVVAYASAYVYSPKRQKARMWLGMNDGIRVWLNGRLVHKGIYKAIVLWDEANVPDQVVPTVILEKGWNSVLVKVENLPKTPEQLAELGRTENGWGFSLRLCGLRNDELAGLKWSAEKPAGWGSVSGFERSGNPETHADGSEHRLYRWDDVADDYTTLLPQLTGKDLDSYTGLKGISITKDSLITCAGPHNKQRWLEAYDENDRTLNNLLNWRFESAAALRYVNRRKEARDLVFLRPEAYETYIRLMSVPRYGGVKRHADRVLGYVLVDGLEDHPNGRVMLVLDTFLGETLPRDEKDLLDLDPIR